MWEVLNAIFYVLCEGCRWRALPGDFPAWQTVYTYFRKRKDGTWLQIHDRLRVDANRAGVIRVHPKPSLIVKEKCGAVVEDVGYDAGKQIKGRKRFLSVDTLGLVLRVLVTASVGEREGANKCSNGSNRCIRCAGRFGWMALMAYRSCSG